MASAVLAVTSRGCPVSELSQCARTPGLPGFFFFKLKALDFVYCLPVKICRGHLARDVSGFGGYLGVRKEGSTILTDHSKFCPEDIPGASL